MFESKQNPRWKTVMAVCLLTLLVGLNPRVSQAVPKETALKICLAAAAVSGAWPAAAGCLAGYSIFGATVDGTFPKFHFPEKTEFPSSPLGRDIVFYTIGVQEVLSVGLWKGCPPECTTGVTLVTGQENVRQVTFSIVSSDELAVAENFDDANWAPLGKGKFNRKKNTWELPWDTTVYTEDNGYIIRADFLKDDGKIQTGVGFAIQEWLALENCRAM